jgi:hypothetical protein
MRFSIECGNANRQMRQARNPIDRSIERSFFSPTSLCDLRRENLVLKFELLRGQGSDVFQTTTEFVKIANFASKAARQLQISQAIAIFI